MMAPEPLKSAMTIGNAEDTSLALPTDATLRTGQARVLDQVHTIKRSKSKQGKNGNLSPSPTSLASFGVSESSSFKFTPFKANGLFSRSNSAKTTFNKSMHTQRSRTLSTKSMGGRFITSSGVFEQPVGATHWPQGPNGLKPSRSDPALAPPLAVAPTTNTMRAKGQTTTQQIKVTRHSSYSLTNGGQMTTSQTPMGQAPSDQSNTESKITKSAKSEQKSILADVNTSELTLKEAVKFLTHEEDNFQQWGATFIQHSTFKDEGAKQEVSQLGGVPPLVGLLRSPYPGVSQAAAGALRNLVFKNGDNKQQVQDCGGIEKALQLLKETDSTETQKQVTGLLWNLSSTDELKSELIATALPVLTENVIMPFTCWSENTANHNIHPEVFYNATGCLRNLSCAQKEEDRGAMRLCPGLIDSLVSYTQSCMAEENPDDKSVENSTCILHNLTYQLEAEARECFSNYYPPESAPKKAPATTGCFSPKSSKSQKEFTFDNKPDGTPTGVMWLSHPKTMQLYLSLLGSTQKDGTLEACCGALQNLTASRDPGSIAMSHILVEKLGVLQYVAPLLKSPNQNLQKTAISLLSNLSKTNGLQSSMAKQVLPGLASNLINGPRKMGYSDETTASICSMVQGLMSADSEAGKKALSSELISALADLSEDGSYPTGSKAAALLLYSLWGDKSLQGAAKKMGFTKALFVNGRTTAVRKSTQVIE